MNVDSEWNKDTLHHRLKEISELHGGVDGEQGKGRKD